MATVSNVKETQSMPKTTYTMKTHAVTPLKDRRPRIIVEVLETDHKAAGESGNSSKIGNGNGNGNERSIALAAASRLQRETRLDILNASSLIFHMKTHAILEPCKRIMNFDCVANGSADQVMRWQMSSLIDRLLITGRNNCCLLRVSPQRNRPTLQVLSHMLIPEINKRLSSPEIAPLLLYAIRIEFYDVRKYDVVNMILRAAPKNRPRHHLTFRNTWELLHWVQEVYPSLWALGAGHECLDLKFIFIRDRSGSKVRVKLSLLQFYLAKMDMDMIAGLRNFLENAGANSSARIKHSILTDYLREYFFSPDNWYIWMVFEAPTSKSNGIVNDVLTMASAAYAGVQGLIEGKPKVDGMFTTKPDVEPDLIRPVINCPNISAESSRNSTTVKSSGTNSAAQIALRFRKKEKQSLSYWYRQMDEKFLNVLHTMEAFYARKKKEQKNGSGETCTGDIGAGKSSNKTKERREFISTVRNSPAKEQSTSHTNDYAMHTLTLNYKQAVDSLHTLMHQMERCPFARQLKVLIQTRNEDLMNHLETLKADKNEVTKPPAVTPKHHRRSEKDNASIKSKMSSNV